MLIDQTAFRDRGLSSDTSLLIDFAVEEALRATRDRGLLAEGGVRRVGIVGPGLDFTDKDEGYDFYPQQTIQPFAVIDSLVELGLAPPAGPSVTAFDLNPRIIRHLEAARERAAAGEPYVLALPRNLDLPWNGPLVRYWERLGAAIGDAAGDLDAPPGAGNVRVRAVHVRPSVVLSIAAADLNIVLQRLEPLPPGKLFDLIVATDILVYYDVFEQSLALANVAAMLRPGGDIHHEYHGRPVAGHADRAGGSDQGRLHAGARTGRGARRGRLVPAPLDSSASIATGQQPSLDPTFAQGSCGSHACVPSIRSDASRRE